MRKVGLWVLFLVTTLIGCFSAVSSYGADETVIIASWNVQGLGGSSADAKLQKLADVVGLFDIVALQEIQTEPGIKRLIENLNQRGSVDEWDYVISAPVGEGKAAECYAFVYRTDRVSYVDGSKGIYPEPMPDDFAREPFYATFQAGEFDFTLITIHITWGESTSLRTIECRRLQSVWCYVQNLDPEEDDLILLGDFNRDKPTHSAFLLLSQMNITHVLTETGTRTTFGKTADGGHWYDNIWVDPKHTGAELTDQVGAGTPIENSSGTGCPTYIEEASDHCPVWAVFRTISDDDPSCP